jgi:osmotically inducible protein OsmC
MICRFVSAFVAFGRHKSRDDAVGRVIVKAVRHYLRENGNCGMIDYNQGRRAATNRNSMNRTASAVWHGGLKDGKGTISTESGVLSDTQYSFSTRFENGRGTNPEELIAAAHAGCFTMALSAELGKIGMTAESLATKATLTMEKTDAGFTVTKINLDVTAKIPGAKAEAFDTAAKTAKANCPISRLLKAEITMSAKLEA